MELWLHLKLYAEKEYRNLLIHHWVRIEDKYIFIANSLLREANIIALKRKAKIEVINIDIDEYSKIPTFYLYSREEMDESFMNKWHFLFFVASMKN